jgi:hypothetical protein
LFSFKGQEISEGNCGAFNSPEKKTRFLFSLISAQTSKTWLNGNITTLCCEQKQVLIVRKSEIVHFKKLFVFLGELKKPQFRSEVS